MAVSPGDFLFALVGSVVMAALATGMALRGRGLGGASLDYMAALYVGAAGMLGAVVAAYSEWTFASQVLVVGSAGGALVALTGASLRVAGWRAARVLGASGLRWILLASAVALSAFGWGAVAGSPGQEALGAPGAWVAGAVAAAAAAALFSGAVAVVKARLPPVVSSQLMGGTIAVSAGFVLVSTAAVMTGSALVTVGATLVYSAARGSKPTAQPSDEEPAQAPTPPPPRATRASREGGVKVRVPKGSAARVTRFRDDGLPPGGNG